MTLHSNFPWFLAIHIFQLITPKRRMNLPLSQDIKNAAMSITYRFFKAIQNWSTQRAFTQHSLLGVSQKQSNTMLATITPRNCRNAMHKQIQICGNDMHIFYEEVSSPKFSSKRPVALFKFMHHNSSFKINYKILVTESKQFINFINIVFY